MTDWREHNGGPQPVPNGTVIEVEGDTPEDFEHDPWSNKFRYRVPNQHLIDAARLEGIRLGLEAAAAALDLPNLRLVCDAIRTLNPETIAQAGLIKPARSDLPPSSSDTITQETHND